MYKPYFNESDDSQENALAHFGVLGMKWGVRKARGSNSDFESKRTAKIKSKIEDIKEDSKEWKEIGDYQKSLGTTRGQKKKNTSDLMIKNNNADLKSLADQLKRSKMVDEIIADLESHGKLSNKNARNSINALSKTKISMGKNIVKRMFYSNSDLADIAINDYVKKGTGW